MKSMAALILLFLLTNSLFAQTEIPVWPEGTPFAFTDTTDNEPTITIHLAPDMRNTGAAVLICPGGGYTFLSMEKEGHEVAEFFNSFGVNAFVLKYRHGNKQGTVNLHPVPFNDASRALRTLRFYAVEYGLDPERIGIMGFSAGGHLASTVGTLFDHGNPESEDVIERESNRPDFMILIYPVIALDTPFTHRGSRQALLGSNPDPELVKKLATYHDVTTLTPPTFLLHTTEDQTVPVENSLLFYKALRDARVPAELHIYEKGNHGFGLGTQDKILSTWPNRLKDWMRSRGILETF